MALTPQDVDHVATLARLGITDEERARFAQQLSGILEHFRALQELDTEGIPPTAQVLDLRNVMRPDVVRPSWPREEILMNAPRREDGFFKIQAVLEE
jgi:aspartyl-tRNA(Asn)/glutamyl-tRNA(Gln) amidotransferase subunit C